MADAGERALSAFSALPHALLLAVLALLPVDQRLRCREVCRGWHAALEDRSQWARLDLSAGSGVAAAHLENAAGLLAAAALRAGSQLRSLNVAGCRFLDSDALRGVVGGSAATLRELRVGQAFWTEDLALLLRAAPHLQLLHADLLSLDEWLDDPIRNEQLFTPLRLLRLRVSALAAAASAMDTRRCWRSLSGLLWQQRRRS
jgi:hypothetical protein